MDEKSKTNRQLHFFRQLEDIVPSGSSLVCELSDILGISADSAYRRMRGETALSLDEVAALCEHFNISFDSFCSTESGNVSFKYKYLNKDLNGFETYLKDLLKDLLTIKSSKEKQIVYASRDVPVFHNYRYKDLSAFKMFYWMKSVMNVPDFENEQFRFDMIPESFHSLGSEIFLTYMAIPSIELWTETTLNSVVKQIEFYWDSGLFKSLDDAIRVCDALRAEVLDIQKQAEESTKFITEGDLANNRGNFEFYCSDIEIGNNHVLVTLSDIKMVFHSHHTFYIMSTSNSQYVKETEEWVNNLIKKATLISGVSAKHRYQYFRKAIGLLDNLVAKIRE